MSLPIRTSACHCKKPTFLYKCMPLCPHVKCQLRNGKTVFIVTIQIPWLSGMHLKGCTCREANQATPIRLFCRCFGVSRSRGCRRAFSESLLSRYPVSNDITRSNPNLPSFSPVVTRPSFMKCTSACTSVEDICETAAFLCDFFVVCLVRKKQKRKKKNKSLNE